MDNRDEQGHDPGRRQLLASAVLPGLERLLKPLERKSDSYTEWFNAVQTDDAARCRQLLQRGFDPNTVESERFDTALILAVRHKSWKVFSLLLGTRGVNLDARSRNGDTALMIAAFAGELMAVRSLIDKGAEINRPEWTALHYAAAVGNLPVIRLLLEHSAYIDAESPNKTTPLMMAARAGHDRAVLLLLEEGADASLKNELGLDAIDFARSQGHERIVSLLQQRLERDQASGSAKRQKQDANANDTSSDMKPDSKTDSEAEDTQEASKPETENAR